MNMKKKVLKFIFDLLWKSDDFQTLVQNQLYSDVIYPNEQIISDYEQIVSKLTEQISELTNNKISESDNSESVKPKRHYRKKTKSNK